MGKEHVHPGDTTFKRCIEFIEYSIIKSLTSSRFSKLIN